MAATVPAVSTEYLHGPVTASVVLDTQPVEVAIEPKTKSSPDADTVWHTAEWVGDPGTTRTWRLLIGQQSTIPLVGGQQYNVWVRIVDAPEQPVRKHDVLTII